jgi:hypothetical protein
LSSFFATKLDILISEIHESAALYKLRLQCFGIGEDLDAGFRYEPDSDTYVCPGNKRLLRKSTNHKNRYTMYKASAGDCGTCSLKSRCTQAPRRGLARHLYEEALNRTQARVTPEAMRLRRSTVEHPFATMKYRIFGHPRLLMRGLSGAKVEIGLATMAYNLKRIANVLGTVKLTEALYLA